MSKPRKSSNLPSGSSGPAPSTSRKASAPSEPTTSTAAENEPCRKPCEVRKRSNSPCQSFPVINDFADLQEIAAAIARSKGQSVGEFVASVSRHTRDCGQALRSALRVETSTFYKYVGRVLDHRIKDLTDSIAEEQSNEVGKINSDIDKWQSEMGNCRRKIHKLFPDFNRQAYEKDRHYLDIIFAVEDCSRHSEDDLVAARTEDCRKAQWFERETLRLIEENEQMKHEIMEIETRTLKLMEKGAARKASHLEYVDKAQYEVEELKFENEKLNEEISCLSLILKRSEKKKSTEEKETEKNVEETE